MELLKQFYSQLEAGVEVSKEDVKQADDAMFLLHLIGID